MKRTLLAVLLAAAVAAPGCKKPPPPPAAPSALAQVYAVKGTAYVTRGTTKTEATPRMPLERMDRLTVGPASVLLLEVLANHQVVRLDEDLELTVGELALLGATTAGSTVEQQVDILLGANERPEFSNRTAGWVVAQQAARVPVAQAESDALAGGLAPEAEGQAAEPAVAPSKTTSAAPPAPPRAEPPAPPREEDVKADEPEDKPKLVPSRLGKASPEKKEEVASAEAPAKPPPSPVVSDEGTAPLADERLRECIEEVFAQYGPAVRARYAGRVVIQYRLKNGELRARMPDGLPLTDCTRSWLKEHEARLAPQETWKDLPVLVK